jgi:hypothetical protein
MNLIKNFWNWTGKQGEANRKDERFQHRKSLFLPLLGEQGDGGQELKRRPRAVGALPEINHL